MLKNRKFPFGYCIVNGKYALNTTEVEAVKQIFDQYIGGKSLKAIAAEMRCHIIRESWIGTKIWYAE